MAASWAKCARDTASSSDDYAELYAWSIREPEAFWQAVWSFCDVVGDPGERVVVDKDRMPGARWFPDARLNFAENLLRRRDDATALVFRGEDRVRSSVTYARALRGGLAPRAGAARSRRRPRRPRRRLLAEHAGRRHRDARGDEHRRDLVFVLAGFRRAGRARSLRPDRAQGAVRRRRLLLRRQDASTSCHACERSSRNCRRSSTPSSCRTRKAA